MFNILQLEEMFKNDCKNIQDLEGVEHPYINISDVLRAHYYLADYFLDESSGEIEKMSVGVRSYQLLGSAIGRQLVWFGGRRKYSDPIAICSTLFYGLVTDHAFVDGNKRTALLVLLFQLQLYGFFPKTELNSFEKLVLSTAERSLNIKYRHTFKKFKSENYVDNEVSTITYELRRMTEKTDRSFHLNMTMKDFCNKMNSIGVLFELDNSKIKFYRTQKSFLKSKKFSYIVKFYGWTRPVEAGMVRDVFDNLGLTEEYASYQSWSMSQDPFYKLIKEFEGPLRRLKDK